MLFSTDGTSYRGLQWRGVTGAIAFSDWTEYRVYYPDLAGNSTVYVKWKFISDSSGTEEGPWIDDLHIERYDEPASSNNCEQKNPTIAVPNTPGNTPVSKGVVLPPYLTDDLDGRIQRLRDSGVNWVRLEFIAAPNLLSAVKPGAYTANDQLNNIDLKYYDQLIDSLCASSIAVLGLVDNQTLLDQSWKPLGQVSPAYLAAFTGVTGQLVDYFDDRIGYWEVWNEPDNEMRRLGFQDYARLLAATHDMIKATDPSDQVLFGGLGGADPTAQTQLDNFYAQLDILGRTNPSPYDIFAIHPYPSLAYFPGNVETNPAIYMPQFEQAAGPTILHKFMFIELAPNGDVDKPIWVTELGWNRAGDPEGSDVTKTCKAVNQGLVTGPQQALFLTSGFNILFQQTAWDWDAPSPTVPSVRKVFWYQYQDTGVPIKKEKCGSVAVSNLSPSWQDSYVARYVFPAGAEVIVDWWFGLYGGQMPTPQPNLVQCTYQRYPDPNADRSCLGLTENLFLPLVQAGEVVAATGR